MPAKTTPRRYQSAAAPRSHTARVVDALGLAIVSGQLPPGNLLPGDGELTETYGVSRTVLREALKTLAAKGLVQAKARIGTRVRERADWNFFDPDVLVWHARTGFDPDFLIHLGEMRMALEPEAAALAALRRTPAQLESMWGWMRRLAAPDISPDDFISADLGLHLAIAEAAGNPFFRSISALIEVAVLDILKAASPTNDPVKLAASVADQRGIVEAIETRNLDAARAAMRAVVQKGIDRSKS